MWLEDIPGTGTNWYLILPNVCGVRPDGTPFCGVAIKLHHGVAISFDGRVVRHCTTVSKPDGDDKGYVTRTSGDTQFENTLYGMFTAAKEKILRAGRSGCGNHYYPMEPNTPKGNVPKRRRRNNRNENKKRRKAKELKK